MAFVRNCDLRAGSLSFAHRSTMRRHIQKGRSVRNALCGMGGLLQWVNVGKAVHL